MAGFEHSEILDAAKLGLPAVSFPKPEEFALPKLGKATTPASRLAMLWAGAAGLFIGMIGLALFVAPQMLSVQAMAPLVAAGLCGGAALWVRRSRGRMLWLLAAIVLGLGSLFARGWLGGEGAGFRGQMALAVAGTAVIALAELPTWGLIFCAALSAAGLAALMPAGGEVWSLLFAGQIVATLVARLRPYGRRSQERGMSDDFALKTLELPGTDLLTGAGSRKLFDEELNLSFDGDPGVNIAVLLIDADNFKVFNKLYGYQAGDRCLAALARAMQQQLRGDVDLLARYHGSEFAAMLPGADLGDAARVAERIRRAIEDLAIPHGDVEKNEILTVSIGFAAAPRALSRPERLVNAADASLYAAKQAGRNRIAPQLVRPGFAAI